MPATVAGFTPASTVSVLARSSEAESGTETIALLPSKASAPPYLPATRVACESVPSLALPELSLTTEPDDSSKFQEPTRPEPAAAARPGAAIESAASAASVQRPIRRRLMRGTHNGMARLRRWRAPSRRWRWTSIPPKVVLRYDTACDGGLSEAQPRTQITTSGF